LLGLGRQHERLWFLIDGHGRILLRVHNSTT
jgi:hypothetical protein